MRIRDDRRVNGTLPTVTPAMKATDYDAVLYDCPQCHQSHLVTVNPCPDAETAWRETMLVDGAKRAA